MARCDRCDAALKRGSAFYIALEPTLEGLHLSGELCPSCEPMFVKFRRLRVFGLVALAASIFGGFALAGPIASAAGPGAAVAAVAVLVIIAIVTFVRVLRWHQWAARHLLGEELANKLEDGKLLGGVPVNLARVRVFQSISRSRRTPVPIAELRLRR